MGKIKILVKFCICSLFPFLLNGQVNLEDGLQAHYSFDGNPNDISGNGYHGINYQAILTADRFGNTNQAYDFSGGDKYLVFGNVLNETFAGVGNKFSISFWIKPAVDNMSNNVIIGKNSDSACDEDERQYTIRLFNNQKLNITYQSSLTTGNYRAINTTLSIADTSKWYHGVVQYDGSLNSNDGHDRVTVYVDCELQQTVLEINAGLLGNIQPGNAPMSIGSPLGVLGNLCPPSRSFEGIIDDVRIYNRIINEEEVVALCTIGTSSNEREIESSKKIKVYPNPTSRIIYIETSNDSFNNFIIRNVLGKIVQMGSFENQPINLIDLPDGVYYLELLNKIDKVTKFQKFIVQN